MGLAERTTPQTRLFPNQTDRNINLQSGLWPKHTLLFSRPKAWLTSNSFLRTGFRCFVGAVTGLAEETGSSGLTGLNQCPLCCEDGLCALAQCLPALSDHAPVQSQDLCVIGLLFL